MRESGDNLRACILDRLVDLEPGVSHEPVQTSFQSIGQIKASLVRDLEKLLNTKRQITMPPGEYRELNNSLFVYGLRDFTAQNPRSLSVRQQLRQDVEKTISRFEPRLKNLTVQLEAPAQTGRNFRFRIIGILVVEPIREPVSFDTYYDVNRSEYKVSL
jgi:type VI secretion system protein ImpF